MTELIKNKRNSFLENLNLSNNALMDKKYLNDVDAFAAPCPGAVECDACAKRKDDREERMMTRKQEESYADLFLDKLRELIEDCESLQHLDLSNMNLRERV